MPDFILTRFPGYDINVFTLPWAMNLWYIPKFFVEDFSWNLTKLGGGILLSLYNAALYILHGLLILFQWFIEFLFWLDDLSWIYFDNFYTGLQEIGNDYDSYISVYPGTYFIWLLFWPFIYLWQFLYYFFN